jgi:hypothetical protein
MHHFRFHALFRCLLVCLALILSLGILAACNKTPPNEGTTPPENEENKNDPNNQGTTKPPKEPYVPNTEPLVRLNLEGKTPEIMAAKRDEFLAEIRK